MPAKKDLTFYNLRERRWLTRLDRASIVGHTTSTNTKLWMRFKGKGEYLIVISETPLHGEVSKPPKESDGQWSLFNNRVPLSAAIKTTVNGTTDFTYVLDTEVQPQIADLIPETRYYFGAFNLQEKVWELGIERAHTFMTLPENRPGPWDITFGLYSCHMPFDPKNPSKADAGMWDLMEKELQFSKARFVIGGGDQVYADGVDHLNIWKWLKKVKDDDPSIEDMLSWYRDIYRGYWGFTGVQAVFRQFPNYMTWDDHEIMDGWGSYTKDELSNELDTIFEWEDKKKNLRLADRMFKAATHVYKEYQHSHNPTAPIERKDADCYDYSFSNCGSDHYVLDMRAKRDFQQDHKILGSKQLKRFKRWSKELARSENDGPIFITSTVPMVHLKDFVANVLDWLPVFGARDDVRDHWAHAMHGTEFNKILTTIFKSSHQTKRPIVILSGDVHIGAVFRLFCDNKKYADAKVFQLTSSAITYAALGPLKMGLLAKATAETGIIGPKKDVNSPKKSNTFSFKKHLVFPQYNFALINYKTDGKITTNIEVELVGRSEDSRVKESTRIDLLRL